MQVFLRCDYFEDHPVQVKFFRGLYLQHLHLKQKFEILRYDLNYYTVRGGQLIINIKFMIGGNCG